MKATKWVVVLLAIVTATLIFVRQRKGDVPTPVPASPVVEAEAERASASAATSTEAIVKLSPGTSPVAVSPQEGREDGNYLRVIVQNEQGQPLEGASARTAFRAERGSAPLTNFNRTFTTSAQGQADVLYPTQSFPHLELVVSKEDYAARRVMWDLKAGDSIPPTYTVKLKAGVQVGGVVVDPEGNPVEDATVSLSRFWRGGEERPSNKGEESTFLTQKHTTGIDGRWKAHSLPAELMERIFISGAHSNFIGVRVDVDGKPQVERDLRAGTYKLELKRGLMVRGRVINEAQQPIADAQVWAGRKYTRERQETKSDAEGRFTFRNVNEGKVDFSVMAEGYAPDTKLHTVSAATEEIVFRLAKGSVIRATVQDETNQPLEGVRVALEGPQGDVSHDRYEFSALTDREGKFEWKSAPNSPLQFYFGRTGYEQKRGIRLKPGEDNVVTLRRSRQVQGLVLDAETDKPVTRFTVSIGRYHGEKQFYTDSSAVKEFKNEQGLFTIDVNEEEQNGIEAAATGYLEHAQALPAAKDGDVKVVLKLKPSQPLAGVVVTPDGQPVPGVKVALVDGGSGGRSIQFSKGQLRSPGSRTKLIITDASGRFEIPSPPDTGTIVAANASGSASASVAEVKASGILTLQSFGRIEGVLMQGTAPTAGQELLLTSPNSGIHFEFETTMQTTDASGRFAFENVPAGTFSVVRLVRTSSRSRMHSHRTDVVVTPGQTSRVVLGGTDATLQGRVRFETPPTETDYILSAQLRTVAPQVPPGLTPEQRATLFNSPEWKEQMQSMKYYSAPVAADGTLTMDSIVPGQYTLNVTAQGKDDESFSAKPLASGQTTVTIPVGAAPGAAISIGEVLLKPAK